MSFEELINLFPCLYDPRNIIFQDRTIKRRALETLQTRLNNLGAEALDLVDVRRKVRNYQAVLRRSRRRSARQARSDDNSRAPSPDLIVIDDYEDDSDPGTLSLTETNQSLAEPTTSRQCQDRMEPFTEINTGNKIPINLRRKFSSTELGTSTEEAEMDIASAKKNGNEPFTEINTGNKIPINLRRKFSSTELGTSTEAEMDIASCLTDSLYWAAHTGLISYQAAASTNASRAVTDISTTASSLLQMLDQAHRQHKASQEGMEHFTVAVGALGASITNYMREVDTRVLAAASMHERRETHQPSPSVDSMATSARQTPRNDYLGSSNQRLFSRITRSPIPTTDQNLKPKIIHGVTDELKRLREKQVNNSTRPSLITCPIEVTLSLKTFITRLLFKSFSEAKHYSTRCDS
ncbi:hypothetical protein MSG28_015425 [Choristoneura fumiferana]|uniref:Uncharacterized protein n=1 Tax=Choristoneura fumiferana TaxID=7141 RepID=A0ACC0KB08_CHOFU|nr:hypothetical protein MSG28_015425 [Choristoneura fumiferana]